MKLILPQRGEQGSSGSHELGPGVSLSITAMTDLPYDLRRWGDQAVLGDLRPDEVRVHEVTDLFTDDGWPMTLVRSDLVESSSWPVVRRLHALYRFLQFGVVAVASGEPAKMDAMGEALVEIFKQGRPDFRTDEVVALAQLFAGL